MIGSECYGYGSIKANNTTMLPPRTHRKKVLFFNREIIVWDFEAVQDWWFNTSDKWSA